MLERPHIFCGAGIKLAVFGDIACSRQTPVVALFNCSSVRSASSKLTLRVRRPEEGTWTAASLLLGLNSQLRSMLPGVVSSVFKHRCACGSAVYGPNGSVLGDQCIFGTSVSLLWHFGNSNLLSFGCDDGLARIGLLPTKLGSACALSSEVLLDRTQAGL